MLTYRGRNERDARAQVFVTAETDIQIDGAAARLADLVKGERITALARYVRIESEWKLVAFGIYATRANPAGGRTGVG